MNRYAVAGNPVAHSRSPFIHERFAAATGRSVRYERLLCPLDGFAAAIDAFAESGASGCNVTVPFKFEAFALARRRSDRALLAGAVNTLRFDAEGWFGDNTDGAGLVADIARAGTALAQARVLLIGAGGAAAGALGPLLTAGAAEVVVANRTLAKAQGLVDKHRALARASGGRLTVATLDAPGHAFDVVVNASASSLGGSAAPVPHQVLREGTLALDMMYGPAAAPFLRWAEAHRAQGRDGLGMLVEQAAEAFWMWQGVRPATDAVLQDLRAQLAAAA